MTALFATDGAPTLRDALGLSEQLDGPWPIHQGWVGSHRVVLLEVGAGKVAAAAAVAYVRQRFNPNQGFWLGVAGALNPKLQSLDLLVAQDSVQYDVDITPFGRQPGELATGERFIPADTALSARVLRTAQNLGLPVQTGRIASADRLLADPQTARQVYETFGADAAEMEGAAALWTAKRMGLPMALVRVVTDGVGEARTPEAFIETASRRLAILIANVLEPTATTGYSGT